MKIYKKDKDIEQYFKDNNLLFTKCHKNNYHRYQVIKVFDDYFFNSKKKFNIDNIVLDLNTVIKSLDYLYKKALLTEKDYRNGFETYGYATKDSIKSDLIYISSKWECAFRIKWLIDLVNNWNSIKGNI